MTDEGARAAVYGRQSRGKEKSINDQLAECERDAREQGWRVSESYQDGTSASRFARKDRDDWTRVLTGIESNAFDVLVLWESSRGDRDAETWLGLLRRCRKSGVRIRVTNHERTYDLRIARDWKTLADEGIESHYETEKLSSRVRRGLADSARSGRPHGPAPYGYRRTFDPTTGKPDGQVIEPDEATVVRHIVGRVADGHPVSHIARDLDASGVANPRGAARWYRQRVTEIATNHAYVGKRSHRGELYDATWPALVDADVFYRAQRVLSDASRVTTRPGRVRHLLSYLATCDTCGGQVSASKGRYNCNERGCVGMVQRDADEYVTEVVLTTVAAPDVYARLRQADDVVSADAAAARAEVATLRARLDEFRLSAARGETSPASLATIEVTLTRDIQRAERRAQTVAPVALRSLVTPGVDVRERWGAMPVAARRDAVRALMSISIARSSRPGGRANGVPEYDRVRIAWKGAAPQDSN